MSDQTDHAILRLDFDDEVIEVRITRDELAGLVNGYGIAYWGGSAVLSIGPDGRFVRRHVTAAATHEDEAASSTAERHDDTGDPMPTIPAPQNG